MADLTGIIDFLGDNRVASIILPEATEAFQERFGVFLAQIKLAKKNDDKEKVIELAIQKLMETEIEKSGGVLDWSQDNNYDATAKNSSGAITTLMECKKVSTKEMVSPKNLNRKALQQLIYYYLAIVVKDAKTKPHFMINVDMKNLVITNGMQWFVWRGSDFYRLISKEFIYETQKTNLAKVYSQIDHSKENYKVIEEYINQVGEETFRQKCFHLDLSKIDDVEKLSPEQWTVLYHFFSASVWLGRSAYLDANSLNKEFYHELLHIMGLKEVDMKGGEGIKIIVPNPAAVNSLYDQVRSKWKDDCLPASEILHEGVFENIIPWVNRVLFLKLLEAHIVSARANEERQKEQHANFAFMEYGQSIRQWSDLYELFFKVLAVEEPNRESVSNHFKHIPYLNSSLFTFNAKVECVSIDQLINDERKPLPLYSKSVLAYEERESMPLLEYLLKFLSAYAFTTDGKSTVEGAEANLINASVLGKVFEKLNGYKDGSFYTPSFITTYICRESIQQALVGRVNAQMQRNFADYAALHKAYLKMDEAEEAQLHGIIKSLTVLDPAVGSGHFLVSALNELIQIRYDFMMFTHIHHKKGFDLSLMNDEIVVRSSSSNQILRYNVYNHHTQHFQEELFSAKQEIIENNLFGVDINPNSVEICRLRLWIELLKSSHYIIEQDKKDQLLHRLKTSTDYVAMATLPNIDINIKTGNSLLYSLPLNDKIDDLMRNELLHHLKEYAQAVQAYKRVRNKPERRHLEAKITELSEHKIPLDLMFSGQDSQLGTEWRYLFPESLDAVTGNFVGFDVVVGNPPYIQLQKMRKEIKIQYEKMRYTTFDSSGDIYMLFYELGMQLLHGRAWGQLGFVTSNKWMMTSYGEKLRQYLMDNVQINTLIDFNGYKVFDNATVDINILITSQIPRQESIYYRFPGRWKPASGEIRNLDAELALQPRLTLFATNNNFLLKKPQEIELLAKIQQLGKPLGQWDVTINRGILTGLNEAFYLSEQQKDALIAQEPKSAEIIVPMLRGREVMPYHTQTNKEWLIASHNGIKAKGIVPINIDDYPVIKQHLDQFETALKKRQDQGDTPYNLRDCAYWQDFSKPKIMYGNMSKYMPFMYDESGFYSNDKSFIITTESITLLKYLTGLLNSHLYFYLWDFYLPKLLGNTYEARKVFMAQVPIMQPTPAQEAAVVALVDAIIAAKQAGQPSLPLEQELDDLIFDLYGLTDAEIALVKAVPQPIKTTKE